MVLAEWGDLTQIGTAALAAHYRAPAMVFVGSVAALWAVAGLAVYLGSRAANVLSPGLTKRVAAVAFALVGGLLLAHLI